MLLLLFYIGALLIESLEGGIGTGSFTVNQSNQARDFIDKLMMIEIRRRSFEMQKMLMELVEALVNVNSSSQ